MEAPAHVIQNDRKRKELAIMREVNDMLCPLASGDSQNGGHLFVSSTLLLS